MAMITFHDEPDLQRKIVELLNKNGFAFEKTRSPEFCDVKDEVNSIYIEVKPEAFAPAQLLYGLARNSITNARYIGLASAYEVRFYKCPSFALILDFARTIDPGLEKAPSSVNKKSFNDKAFELIGFHHALWDYNGKFDLDEGNREIHLNESNYEYFKMLFTKYNINPAQLLQFMAYIESEDSELKVNKQGWIYESKNLKKYKNEQNGYHDKKRHQQTLNGDTIYNEQDMRPIKNKHDRDLFESIRIRGIDVENLLHKMDEITPLKIRRQIGKFFSGMDLGEYIAGVISGMIEPDLVVEPMVGGGSLMAPFVEAGIPCIINDINKGHVDLLKEKYGDAIKGYHSDDFILTPTDEIFTKWDIPREGTLLVYTNPPFGTASTNRTSSKTDEIRVSRSTKIEYGGLGDKYGRGDLVLPSVGRMIEVVKHRGSGYLAFFSPFAAMTGRRRFVKLLRALLENFEFLYGEVFTGKEFNDVSKNKTISVTIWRYKKGAGTDHESLQFIFGDKVYTMKVLSLLKDGWKYDTRKHVRGEIGIQGNDRFSATASKIMYLDINKGGSEMVPENVKKSLNIKNVPDELAYGLWSIAVGRKATIVDFPSCPEIFDTCTHLPDFTKKETLETLAYIVISQLILESKNNYCDGRIGFKGMRRAFQFGGNRLTDGAMYLIEAHGDCPLGTRTIMSVFDELKGGKQPDDIDPRLRIEIRREVEKRLDAIGYWDYLPIPDVLKKKKK